MDFKKGDLVIWRSQANGNWKTKVGTVEHVFYRDGKPTQYAVMVKAPYGSKAKPKMYYPRHSALNLLK
ncbi:hypothetical protein [Klebsiella oxytoca]|uniref:hypothetical protein n=1 Tax=Klebsiella oxytoca TaxID=571 RepID=UPI0011E83515|nr:hypothetical protein [Klebsiella oxytoca]HBU7484759.1 hypothetical protein [Klebsiella oxytoca]HBV5293375.1 hypothetical protein [Klebsiella oxytoca]HCK2575441.1 hypothetical protein [Klebsiella oxytoca]